METKLEKEVRILKAYAVVPTLLCAVFVPAGFTLQSRKQKTVTLFDPNSRPRLRMVVGPDGEPKLEFLDATGKALQTLPNTSSAMKN